MILNVCNLPGTLYDNYAQHLIGKSSENLSLCWGWAGNSQQITAENTIRFTAQTWEQQLLLAVVKNFNGVDCMIIQTEF